HDHSFGFPVIVTFVGEMGIGNAVFLSIKTICALYERKLKPGYGLCPVFSVRYDELWPWCCHSGNFCIIGTVTTEVQGLAALAGTTAGKMRGNHNYGCRRLYPV